MCRLDVLVFVLGICVTEVGATETKRVLRD